MLQTLWGGGCPEMLGYQILDNLSRFERYVGSLP